MWKERKTRKRWITSENKAKIKLQNLKIYYKKQKDFIISSFPIKVK